jgi:hypothetical protein
LTAVKQVVDGVEGRKTVASAKEIAAPSNDKFTASRAAIARQVWNEIEAPSNDKLISSLWR